MASSVAAPHPSAMIVVISRRRLLAAGAARKLRTCPQLLASIPMEPASCHHRRRWRGQRRVSEDALPAHNVDRRDQGPFHAAESLLLPTKLQRMSSFARDPTSLRSRLPMIVVWGDHETANAPRPQTPAPVMLKSRAVGCRHTCSARIAADAARAYVGGQIAYLAMVSAS